MPLDHRNDALPHASFLAAFYCATFKRVAGSSGVATVSTSAFSRPSCHFRPSTSVNTVPGMCRSPTASSQGATQIRSEEHTSELQSLMRISYAVFCLKKQKTTHIKITSTICNKKQHNKLLY